MKDKIEYYYLVCTTFAVFFSRSAFFKFLAKIDDTLHLIVGSFFPIIPTPPQFDGFGDTWNKVLLSADEIW